MVRQLEQGPPFDAPIEVRIDGPDLDMLQELGRQVRLVLSETEHVIHTRSDAEEVIPKIEFDIPSAQLAAVQLTDAEVRRHLYTTLEGADAGRLQIGEEELPVRVRVARDGDPQLDLLTALPVPRSSDQSNTSANLPPEIASQLGLPAAPQPVPLASIADIALESNRAAITRVNGSRVNEIKAYITAGVLPSTVVDQFMQKLDNSGFELPDGYSMSFGGERAQRTNAVQNLIANTVVLVFLIILTLVALFRSFRHASIIAMVGGLSIGLGPFALWLFGYPFGFVAIVGTMGLVGVAINDSIVVLAAIRENSKAASGDREALCEVVIGSTRHIVATTLTTICGFLPLIIGGGGFWPPLAITIAGGVGGATFMALYLVPSMHLLMLRRGETLAS